MKPLLIFGGAVVLSVALAVAFLAWHNSEGRLDKRAMDGDTDAMMKLSELASERGDEAMSRMLRGMAACAGHKGALKSLREDAEAGDTRAMMFLSSYYDGRDSAKAMEYDYRLAIAKPKVYAAVVGLTYLFGPDNIAARERRERGKRCLLLAAKHEPPLYSLLCDFAADGLIEASAEEVSHWRTSASAVPRSHMRILAAKLKDLEAGTLSVGKYREQLEQRLALGAPATSPAASE